MKIRIKGGGKTMIQGIGREFQDGDTIDLPDDVAKGLLKNKRRFEKVYEMPVKTTVVDIKKKGGKINGK